MAELPDAYFLRLMYFYVFRHFETNSLKSHNFLAERTTEKYLDDLAMRSQKIAVSLHRQKQGNPFVRDKITCPKCFSLYI